MFTSFTQFMIVAVILFAITVVIVDRIEVTRHHRLLMEDALYQAEYRADQEWAKCIETLKIATEMTEEEVAIAEEQVRINKILRAL